LAQTASTDPANIGADLIREGRRLAVRLTPKGEAFAADDFQRTMQEYDRLVTLGRGPSLGFQELDDYFYGQLGLTFLVGAPKSMKSWFTIKAFYENVLAGKEPLLYSLELPAYEADMRLRCMAAKVPYWKFTKRMLTPVDKKNLSDAADTLEQFGSYRIEKPGRGDRTVQKLVEKGRDQGHGAIFIDQLQYIENDRKRSLGGMNETGEYWEAINELRDYSDEGPIFVIHQFNRSVMNADKMPEVQQAKGSAGIEECATLALGLWSSKAMRKSGLLHVGTLVSRNYDYQMWEAQAQMKNSCWLSITDTVDDDEAA
jgi:replicative DNA helicase